MRTVNDIHARLVSALADVRATAHERLNRLDEQWRPFASRLLTWHADAEHIRDDAELLASLKKAESWLKEAAGELRDDRMAPVADQAQAIWRELRQQSSVSLGSVKLTGTSTKRRVSLDVTVDGAPATALGVMSQGELHALGLALFLPRAMMAASPFRFVVIDDPVQAMDPAKVYGLAQVLAEVAKTRQVIVFSHDDRLAEAVRRLPIQAAMWEVQRRDASVVEVVHCADPVDRYLDDARALANTAEMPEDLRRELVANCCRGALEAAAHAKVRTVRLRRGDSHSDVEHVLAAAITTHAKLTLAVFDDSGRHRDLFNRLNSTFPRRAVDTLSRCKKGAHVGVAGDLRSFIRDAEELARWVAQ